MLWCRLELLLLLRRISLEGLQELFKNDIVLRKFII